MKARTGTADKSGQQADTQTTDKVGVGAEALVDLRPAQAKAKALVQAMNQSTQVRQAKVLQAKMNAASTGSLSRQNQEGVSQLFPGAAQNPPGGTVAGNNANVGATNATEAWLASPHQNNQLGNYIPPVNGGQQTMGWAEIQANGNTAKGAWVRFHLINSVVGGGSNADNLVPASAQANLSAAWRQWEDTAKWLHTHGGVYMEVTINYGHGANVGAGAFPTNIRGHVPDQIDGELYLPDTVNNRYKANPGNGSNVPGIGNGGNPKKYTVSVNNPLPPAQAGEIDIATKNAAWLRQHAFEGLSPDGASNIVMALKNQHQGLYSDWGQFNRNTMLRGSVSEILGTMQTWSDLAGADGLSINAHNNILNGLWTLN